MSWHKDLMEEIVVSIIITLIILNQISLVLHLYGNQG